MLVLPTAKLMGVSPNDVAGTYDDFAYALEEDKSHDVGGSDSSRWIGHQREDHNSAIILNNYSKLALTLSRRDRPC